MNHHLKMTTSTIVSKLFAMGLTLVESTAQALPITYSVDRSIVFGSVKGSLNLFDGTDSIDIFGPLYGAAGGSTLITDVNYEDLMKELVVENRARKGTSVKEFLEPAHLVEWAVMESVGSGIESPGNQ